MMTDVIVIVQIFREFLRFSNLNLENIDSDQFVITCGLHNTSLLYCIYYKGQEVNKNTCMFGADN